MTWKVFEESLEDFGQRLKGALSELGILDQVSPLQADHVGLRLATYEQVDLLKEELRALGDIISATEVNGREILIFQMSEPLQVGCWSIRGVEVPYPKPNHRYVDGWEHVEFVLTGAENTMEGLRRHFFKFFPSLDQNILKERYQYEEEMPHAEGDQLSNPSISLRVDGIGIKFHANPIQVVVGKENGQDNSR